MIGYILEFQTSNYPSAVSLENLFLNLYRKRGSTCTRIVQVPAGRQFFQDTTGAPGDEYFAVWFDSVRSVESGPSNVLVAKATPLNIISISGFIKNPDGSSVGANVPVSASLFTHETVPTTMDGAQIATSLSTTTNAAGAWDLSLAPNDLIRPTGTYWKFQILSRTHFKSISSTNGGAQNFTSLTNATPFEVS